LAIYLLPHFLQNDCHSVAAGSLLTGSSLRSRFSLGDIPQSVAERRIPVELGSTRAWNPAPIISKFVYRSLVAITSEGKRKG
jgi:hypothetical protein